MDELPDLEPMRSDRDRGRRRVGARARRAVRALALLLRRARRRRPRAEDRRGTATTSHCTRRESLELWDGDGAVRLLRSDPARRALLEERAVPGDDISELPEEAALEIAVDVARRLWRPAGAPFRLDRRPRPALDRRRRAGRRRRQRADPARARALCRARGRPRDADPRRLPPPQHPAPRRPVRRDRLQGDARRSGVRHPVVPAQPALLPDDRPRADRAADRGVRRGRPRRLQDPRLDGDPRCRISAPTRRRSRSCAACSSSEEDLDPGGLAVAVQVRRRCSCGTSTA